MVEEAKIISIFVSHLTCKDHSDRKSIRPTAKAVNYNALSKDEIRQHVERNINHCIDSEITHNQLIHLFELDNANGNMHNYQKYYWIRFKCS